MAVGTISITSRELVNIGKTERNLIEKVIVDWVASSTDASVPVLSIDLRGYLIKVITNPGSTAPTGSYAIALQDPEDSALDAAATLLNGRSATATEQVYPVVSGKITPILLVGSYGLAVTSNSVNSATGRIILHLAEEF